MSDDGVERDTFTIVAGVVAALVALVWSAASLPSIARELAPAINNPDWATILGVLIGHLTAIVLLVCIAFGFVIMARGYPKGSSWFYVAVLVAAALPISFALFLVARGSDGRAQAQVALSELRNAYTAFANGTPIDMRIHARGEMAEAERQFKETLKKEIDDGKQFQAEMRSLDFPNFLRARRLAAKGGVALALHKLKQCHTAVRNYVALNDSRIAETRKKLSAIKSNWAADMLKGFDESTSQGSSLRHEVFDDQLMMMDEFEGAVRILAHPKGHWVLAGSQIRFSNSADLVAYNAHMDAVHELDGRIRSIQAQQRANVMQKLLSQ